MDAYANIDGATNDQDKIAVNTPFTRKKLSKSVNKVIKP